MSDGVVAQRSQRSFRLAAEINRLAACTTPDCRKIRVHDFLVTRLPRPLAVVQVQSREDRDRSDRENSGEDCAAVTIDFLGLLRLLVVIQDCSHQNLNQREENK